MVDAAGPTNNAPQGVHHRRHLQTRWWTLSDPLAAPPRWLAINIVFKTRWWMLPDPLVVPPRGPAIDVIFKLGSGRYGPTDSAPKGPAIDIISNMVVDTIGPADSALQVARH
jgi:hypothetical protein